MVNSPNIFKAFRNTLKLLSFFSIFYILMSKNFTIIITKKQSLFYQTLHLFMVLMRRKIKTRTT